MRLRPRTWFAISLLLFAAGAYFWKLGEERRMRSAGEPPPQEAAPSSGGFTLTNPVVQADFQAAATATASPIAASPTNGSATNPFPFRLTNTTKPLRQLVREEHAILLRHALLDTSVPDRPEIPEHLRAQGDPGSYIVQANGGLTDGFRRHIVESGGEIISYIPNNALLVRASAEDVRRIAATPKTAAVLPFEPYYKLDGALLPLAVKREMSPYPLLRVVAYPRETARVREAVEELGGAILGEAEPTPFGDMLVIKAPAETFFEVAQIPEVQQIGVHATKQLANDLSRVQVRVSRTTTNRPPPAPDTTQYGAPTTNDFLTGEGVLVSVADTGVDDTHPDLVDRVFGLVGDPDGHGTHVTATLLGDGTASPLSGNTNALGSEPGAIFSGMAPRARAFVQDLYLPDAQLQQNAALTNALIVNNSWGYLGQFSEYDIAAASYDAAVRDSLPGLTGQQEITYVFSAGNGGGAGDIGFGGNPGSVMSPATAKNVITVGSSELLREITNAVSRGCTLSTNVSGTETNVVFVCETNFPWAGMTDSFDQVARFSSRGNVGIGLEDEFGRFKPDLVAPGTMLVSARSWDYVDPTAVTNVNLNSYNFLTVGRGATNLYSIFIPNNAVRLEIYAVPNANSPDPMPDLLLDVEMDAIPAPPPIATNSVVLRPPDIFEGTLFYTVANPFSSNTVSFDLHVYVYTTNDVGNHYEILRDLNEPLRPHYRYEFGTSMSAPIVSGMLAMMQEYYTKNFGVTNSPALMKALLINGARSLGSQYDMHVKATINHQGWGLPSISNSVPQTLGGTTNQPLRFFDQNVTNALATGGAHTYTVRVPEAARSSPLRVTLVWTDPPGNPVSSLKLVNDLDLYVDGPIPFGTNGLASTNRWIGNDIPQGSDFTAPIAFANTNNTNTVDFELLRDTVNNVENVYIAPPLGDTYTIVVKAHRVNVNAVNSHPEGIVQDYALVVASGRVGTTNNVNIDVTEPVFTNNPAPFLAPLQRNGQTNGVMLFNQRVGANSPYIVSTNGATNQWSFFTFTNVTSFTNVVILTFFPPNLSVARLREADIDLYVAPNEPGLVNLDPSVIEQADRSVGRFGTEFVVYSNSAPGEVYFIGVKSEDQESATFGIFAAASELPFSQRDSSNNIVAHALMVPIDIPDGSPDSPGGTNIFAFVMEQETIQRLYVTNVITHENAGDLIGILSHETVAATLNNHRYWVGTDVSVYDDSDQGDLVDAAGNEISIPTDGPGSLRGFVGEQAMGVWQFTISDNALFHTGRVDALTLVIEPASTNSDNGVDIVRTIRPNRWLYAAINVPADATNLEVCVSQLMGGAVDLYVRLGDFPDAADYDEALRGIQPPGNCLDHDLLDSPPLSPGRYYIGVHNPGTAPVTLRLTARAQRSITPNRALTIESTGTTSLIDDAVTNSSIFVGNRGVIAGVEVDVRLDHPRASDLILRLVHPSGTKFVLAENRGRNLSTGYGLAGTNVFTNFFGRPLDDGFESARGTDGGARPAYGTGEILAGWRVDSDDVDVVHDTYGMTGNQAHTGTNAVDLNGNTGPGSISTNLATRPGGDYLLSFAYCRNPSPIMPSTVTANVELNGVAALNIVYSLPNTYTDLRWLGTSVVFRATSAVTRVGFRQVSPAGGPGGMFIDTVRLDEIESGTNSMLYATFTDDPLKALDPIKFAPPPYGDATFVGSNVFISGFEGTRGGVYTNGDTVVGWNVTGNTVYIQTNSALAYSDTNFLFLRTGVVARVFPTVRGKEYVLQFATRTAGRTIYSTGVDNDDVPLPLGALDQHYIVSSNAPAGVTNAFVLLTNAMGASWYEKTNRNSRWIGIDPVLRVPGNRYYGYRTEFDLAGYDISTVRLSGYFSADDEIPQVFLNGSLIGPTLGPFNDDKFTAFTISPGRFVQRTNRLEFIVNNWVNAPDGTSPHGFRAEFAPDAIMGSLLTNRVRPFFTSLGQVRVPGAYTNFFAASSAMWRMQNVTFVASSNNSVIEFAGITPGVWLDHVQIRETGRKYYLPEEPLTPLIGRQAYGDWKLEIWDDRLGAALTNELLSWRLNLTYVRTNQPITLLAPFASATVSGDNIRYFAVDVPCSSGFVTNTIMSLTPPGTVDLLFNQSGLPTGFDPGDVVLSANTISNAVVLDIGAPPLVRRGRYYLGVRNTDPTQVNDFMLRVDFVCAVPPPPPIIRITAFDASGLTLSWESEPGTRFQVEATSDIAGSWTRFPEIVTSDTGEFSFTDSTAAGGTYPRRFYRVVQVE